MMALISISRRWSPDLWHLDGLGRRRESDTYAVLVQEDWLPLIWDGVMHHGAVLVPLDVSLQALIGTAPSHDANLLAGNFPIRKALEAFETALGFRSADKVDERVSQPCLRFEVN